MATKPNNPSPAKGTQEEPRKGLRIASRSPLGVFRRAGFAFSEEAQTIPLADLKEEQIKALKDERMLVVVEVDLPAAPAADASSEA